MKGKKEGGIGLFGKDSVEIMQILYPFDILFKKQTRWSAKRQDNNFDFKCNC